MAVAPISLTTSPVEPADGGAVRWIRLARPAPGEPEQGKLVIRVRLKNTSTGPVTVTGITVSFPGGAAPAKDMFRPDIILGDGGTFAAGEVKWWSSGVVNVEIDEKVVDSGYNAMYLDLPAPTTGRIAVTASGFSEPATLDVSLAEYACPAPESGYPFYLRAGDLPAAAVLTIRGRHWSNGGRRGPQIYAYDVAVARYTGGAWSATRPGESGQEAHYCYGMTIRSVAAGVVDDLVDDLDNGEDYPKGQEGGNRITIEHDNGEQSYYAHFQKNSFLVAKGDRVEEGTALGLVGWSGHTGGTPHTHIEIHRQSDGALRPYAFRDAWLRERDADTPFDPTSGWTQLSTGRGIPDGSYHAWPSSSRPAWYPPGWAEVMRFGIPAGSYQEEFERATYAGYRPESVDVYEVVGLLFFNAVFRPGPGGWAAQHHMDGAEYQEAYDANKKAGRRLHHLCSYARGNAVNYAAIWRSESGPQLRAYHGKNQDEHQDLVDKYDKDGYHPVNVTVAAPGGNPSWAALWHQDDVGGWRSRSTLSLAGYQQLWDDQVGQLKRQPAYLSSWQDGPLGACRLSAVFQDTAPGSGKTVGKHQMGAEQLQQEYDTRVRAGYLTRSVTGYVDGGQVKYGALWRKP